jgi:hypothetical protein
MFDGSAEPIVQLIPETTPEKAKSPGPFLITAFPLQLLKKLSEDLAGAKLRLSFQRTQT